MIDEIFTEDSGTPITHEKLIAEGFVYYPETVDKDTLDKKDDPFYYFKGPYRLYEVGDWFYSGTTRIKSMEHLKDHYTEETGRTYTKAPMPEDTPPPDLSAVSPGKRKKIHRIRLVGGPGDGQLLMWPKGMPFFLYQEILPSQRVQGHRYKLKPKTKKVYVYDRPTE